MAAAAGLGGVAGAGDADGSAPLPLGRHPLVARRCAYGVEYSVAAPPSAWPMVCGAVVSLGLLTYGARALAVAAMAAAVAAWAYTARREAITLLDAGAGVIVNSSRAFGLVRKHAFVEPGLIDKVLVLEQVSTCSRKGGRVWQRKTRRKYERGTVQAMVWARGLNSSTKQHTRSPQPDNHG